MSCVRRVSSYSGYAIRWAHQIAGLIPPSDHPFLNHVSIISHGSRAPVQPKEPFSLELVARLCDEYNGSASFLVINLAGFLRVDKPHPLKVQNIVLFCDHMSTFISKRKSDIEKVTRSWQLHRANLHVQYIRLKEQQHR